MAKQEKSLGSLPAHEIWERNNGIDRKEAALVESELPGYKNVLIRKLRSIEWKNRGKKKRR